MGKTRHHKRLRLRQHSKTRKIGGVRYLALDCEMIEGPQRKPMVAEVGIVDWNGNTVYHAYVQPTGVVKDYRTAISGIVPEMLTAEYDAKPFQMVQREVQQIIQGNILIGHALDNDLRALRITHTDVRNTAKHPFFQTMNPRGQLQPQKLATLYSRYVGNAEIQQGAHGALEDARATMRVYRSHHRNWTTPVSHSGPVLAPRTLSSFKETI